MNIDEIARMLGKSRMEGSDEFSPDGETRPVAHINEHVDEKALTLLLENFKDRTYQEKINAWEILGACAMRRISCAISRRYGGNTERSNSEDYLGSRLNLND